MQHLNQDFSKLLSIRLFVLTIFFTVVTFNFIDIPIYKYSRSMSDFFFIFFKNFIDPFSDIVDPGVVFVLCLIFLWLIKSTKNIIKVPNKYLVLKKKLKLSKDIISLSLDYYTNIIKHLMLSIIVSGAILHICKYILGVSRPKYFFFQGYERNNFFNFEHKVNSLPSGHTQAAFTIAILCILYINRYNYIYIFLAILMAISRIFMSAHFPSDLILGAYIGCIFPILTYNLYFKKKFLSFKKKKIIDLNLFLKLIWYRLLL